MFCVAEPGTNNLNQSPPPHYNSTTEDQSPEPALVTKPGPPAAAEPDDLAEEPSEQPQASEANGHNGEQEEDEDEHEHEHEQEREQGREDQDELHENEQDQEQEQEQEDNDDPLNTNEEEEEEEQGEEAAETGIYISYLIYISLKYFQGYKLFKILWGGGRKLSLGKKIKKKI